MQNLHDALVKKEALILELEKEKREIDIVLRALRKDEDELRERIFNEMQENGVLQEIVGSREYRLQNKPRAVIVTDESLIPDSFFKFSKTLNKVELNKAVKAGQEIAGVTLDNGGQILIVVGANEKIASEARKKEHGVSENV